MIEEDLHRLNERPLDHSLERLESDIWRGVAARARQRRTARRMVSIQAALMAAALIISVAAGIVGARPVLLAGELALGGDLTPSTLLLGERP